MKVATMTMRGCLLVLASLTVGSAGGVLAADEANPASETTKSAEPAATPEKPKIDIRRLFATNCSWCHQDYGRKAADGPKLAGTTLTEEQVIEQISRGKSPMPGFRKTLSKEQIEALAKYIKELKDPGN
jgi:quinohemoprotein ethanol dehydrogenase